MIRPTDAVRRAVGFVTARLDPSAALGLRLSLLLLVGAGGLWTFGGLLDAVLDNATLVRLDVAADGIIQGRVTPNGLAFFSGATHIGDPKVVAVVAIAGAVVLLRTRHHATFAAWIAVFGGSVVLERVLKYSVHRTRPARALAHVDNQSFSFPSGHAISILVVVSMLLYVFLLYRRPPRWVRITSGIAGAILIALVGVSRVYLGVHYPSDVLGGLAVAAAWMAACIGVSTIIRHPEERR